MITKIKEIIFTDKRKDWNDLVSPKTWGKFFMLHLKLEDDKWVSKYYVDDSKKNMLLDKIKVWESYNIDYKETWLYRNIIQLEDTKWNIII